MRVVVVGGTVGKGKDSLSEQLEWEKVGSVLKGVRWLLRTDWIGPQ